MGAGAASTVIHDQTIRTGEARLAGELGLNSWLAAGLILPVRFYNTSIRYLDPDEHEVLIENPFIHHHNETLTGLGDPWLYGRAATTVGGVVLGGRLGISIPLGRTVPDPFALGDMGLAHEHSQFGTGTFDAIAGIDASRMIGPVHVDATVLTIQSFYANGHGYQAGDRYAAALGFASALGTKSFRFRAGVEAVWETAERWGGVVHTDDGNIGRTDVLAGVEVTWIVNEDWHVGVQLKAPAYTHIKGGQLDALGFFGLSVGTHTHLFGDAEDDHEDAPGDWTGLDKVELTLAAPRTPVPGKITVFDFWATWCKPCVVLDHALAELARKHPGDLAVRKVDVVDEDTPYTLPYIEVFGRDGKLLLKRSAPPLQLAADVEAAIAGPRAKAAIDPNAPRIVVDVTDAGYTPDRIEIPRGTPVTLVFTRRSDVTCATDVHFTLPDGSKLSENLPLGTPVELAIPAQQPGEIRYSCGMNMNHGTIVVK